MKKFVFFSVSASKSLKSALFNIFRTDSNLKPGGEPGLQISRKDQKHMPWSLHSCNDRRYSYFARNNCNRHVDSFKTSLEHDRKHVVRLLRLLKNIFRPGLTQTKLCIKTSPEFPLFLVTYSYRSF